jgi:thiamine monophosphate synthase
LDYARQIAAEIQIPAIAIAGITAQNVDDVLAAGIRAVAVTRAATGQDDVCRAVSRLKELLVTNSAVQKR